jgi:hypothetical protein
VSTDLLAFTRNFEPGGELDRQQPTPHRATEISRVRRGLARMHADDSPRLREAPGPQSPEFHAELTRAVLAVDKHDRELVDTKPRCGADWAQLCATPAKGSRRELALLRIAGKLLHHRVPEPMVLALLHTQNRTMCCPPLAPSEVELLWGKLIDRQERP